MGISFFVHDGCLRSPIVLYPPYLLIIHSFRVSPPTLHLIIQILEIFPDGIYMSQIKLLLHIVEDSGRYILQVCEVRCMTSAMGWHQGCGNSRRA